VDNEEGRIALKVTSYEEQEKTWPSKGRHILAQHDDHSIVVYQAFKPEIGHYAAIHKKFEGAPGFQQGRMTWIKTNFLWMMYRSGWGSKKNQEVTLAIWIKKDIFEEEILAKAVHSSYQREVYKTQEDWKSAVANSEVRLQWDPDHKPSGTKCLRRAIQLGLKGERSDKYASGEWFVDIQDVSDFVAEQSIPVHCGALNELQVPEETVFIPESKKICKWLGVGEFSDLGSEVHVETRKRHNQKRKARKEQKEKEREQAQQQDLESGGEDLNVEETCDISCVED